MSVTQRQLNPHHAAILQDVSVQFEEIKKHYDAEQCWGLSVSLDLQNCDPELIRSAKHIEQYVIELCEILDVNRFGETQIVHFGREEKVEGYSMVQLIETSLISGHFANLTNTTYIDIFSCKIYNPYAAAEFTKQAFKATDVIMNLCYRK